MKKAGFRAGTGRVGYSLLLLWTFALAPPALQSQTAAPGPSAAGTAHPRAGAAPARHRATRPGAAPATTDAAKPRRSHRRLWIEVALVAAEVVVAVLIVHHLAQRGQCSNGCVQAASGVQ